MNDEQIDTSQPGAWLTYGWDMGPYAIALDATPELAARRAAQQGYGQVAFWPFGTDLTDAIRAWEGR